MKMSKGYAQRYNAQPVVRKNQSTVAAEVVQDQNDVGRSHPMVERAREKMGGRRRERGQRPVVAGVARWRSKGTPDGLRGPMRSTVFCAKTFVSDR